MRLSGQEWEVLADHHVLQPPAPGQAASATATAPTILFESESVLAVLKEALVRALPPEASSAPCGWSGRERRQARPRSMQSCKLS